MKLLLPALAFLAAAGGWIQQQPANDVWIIVGGDAHGFLSPCGCTKPMSGGIRRRAAAIRNLTAGKHALILENGGLAHGISRQDELKAEALAETLKSVGVDAVNISASDAALGKGMLESVARLSGGKLVSTSLSAMDLTFKSAVEADGFIIGGVSPNADRAARDLSGAQALPLEEAVEAVILRAKNQPIVLMLDGNETEARRIAESHPTIKLIVYSSQGDPPAEPLVIGNTWLVTPGEMGKSVLRFRFSKGKLEDYKVIPLGPEIPDDPAVSRVFTRYLERVNKEGLLDKLARSPGPKLAGNPTCGTCHIDEMQKWESTKHSGALATLEEVGQDRDPDCVGCHVVELQSEKGFKSRWQTPQFTDVGCESCHGPGGEHALNPSIKMGKVGDKSCQPCHTRDHSPGFDFTAYWQKVKH